MNALVIGGTGPTGPFIVEGLFRRGYEVTVYHRGAHEVEFSCSVNHVHGNPFNMSNLQRDLVGLHFDVVISNYGRLRHIAQVMVGQCGRFIGITSGVCYLGWLDPAHNPHERLDIPISENAPLYNDHNQSHFGTMITLGEKVLMENHTRGLYKATLLRYPMVYGPRQPRCAIWPVVKRILEGRKHIIIPGNGFQISSRGYSENCAHMVLLALDSPKSIGEIYNVADEKAFSLLDFIRMIVKAMQAVVELVPISHPLAFNLAHGYVAMADTPPQHRMYDMTKAISQLGYRDIVTTAEAVKRSVDWILANRSQTAETAQVLDYPYAYELEDKLIATWKQMTRQLSDILPPPPAIKPFEYDYGIDKRAQ